MANKLQSGASVRCVINGQNMGTISDFTYTMLSPRDEDRGLDSLEAFELSPNLVGVQGSFSVFMVRNDEGLEGRNVTDGLPHISREKYFSILLQDRLTGFIFFKAERCSVEHQTWKLVARGLVTGQVSFKGTMGYTHFSQQ